MGRNLLDDKYELLTKLDDSDFWLVRNKSNGYICLKKVLSVYSAEVYEYLKSHPIKNTPVIYDVIEDEGKLTVVEEYMQGTLLSEYIAQRGSLSLEESLDLIKQLCVIVNDLHECDPPIIHRDIKPENIIIDNKGVLKLLDMNAAKLFDENSSSDTYLLGTHGYAAPEQYGFGKATVTSDIYEIGKTLNTMLTGDVNKKTEGIIGEIIDKCTEIDPANRYQSVNMLMNDLNRMKSSKIDYNKLPGFRSEKVSTKICAGLSYALTVAAFAVSTFEGVDDIKEIWCYRIGYFLTFMAMFLFARNYRYIWKTVGINRIENKLLKALIITMIIIGIFFIGIEISVSLGSLIAKMGGS